MKLDGTIAMKPKLSKLFLIIISFLFVTLIPSCGTQTINTYQATAETTLTWQVNYTNDPTEGKRGRFEEFAEVSLTNLNGQKPEAGVFQDDKGLWWPKNPPKPTLDEIEARQQKSYEQASQPELLRQVKYYITYQQNGQTITLPTNYAVYRQVVKAYPQKIPLRLTMGINNGSVEKAEPIN
ncbi:MAG: hypothetical protein QNJ32_28660 [Xenococcaceae cyanobacterium MO_167.B27]|nr:hypothetical protein [Xenococcaceae cyanobacterium MO_167.B27]